jgi:hypothetical protein
LAPASQGPYPDGAQWGDAVYIDTDVGYQLNTMSNASSGALIWNRNYDVRQSILINALILSNPSSAYPSGNTVNICIGSDHEVLTAVQNDTNPTTSGIVLCITENFSATMNPVADRLTLYANGTLHPTSINLSSLFLNGISNYAWYSLDIIVKPVSNTPSGIILNVLVYINGFYTATFNNVTVGSTFPGTYLSINAASVDMMTQSPTHNIRSFSVKSARAWELLHM